MIPFSDPVASFQQYKTEIDEAIARVLRSGWFILGKEVEAFEKEFALFHGNNFQAVGVANGTDAIALCLRSLGLGPGDEIITTSHTAVATVAGIEQANCVPVFADIDPISRCIDPISIKKRISKRTRAIMPVHIYGQPCDMDSIGKIAKSYDLEIIEDCSQAHGAEINGMKVGTFGALAAFSCYPTKNLGGIGDGGIILTKSVKLAEKIKELRQYGWKQERVSMSIGYNSRLDELQAAVLRTKLSYLKISNEKRRAIAKKYNKSFEMIPIRTPTLFPNELHAMHLYVIESEDRTSLFEHLRKNGVGASLHYPLAVHQQPAYSRVKGSSDLPKTEKFYQSHLTLPLYPELKDESVLKIITTVKDYFN
jgi:dTDP-4-amino-4,6-dideoxygalactose transaminase